jgi:hypothetical protein
MTYVAMTHSAGCLPDTAEDLPTFETCEAAWTYLADNLTEDEAWTPEDEDDPEGPHRRSDLALRLEANARLAEQITVVGSAYSDDADYCFTVERAED